jgi:hypothetical protein
LRQSAIKAKELSLNKKVVKIEEIKRWKKQKKLSLRQWQHSLQQ